MYTTALYSKRIVLIMLALATLIVSGCSLFSPTEVPGGSPTVIMIADLEGLQSISNNPTAHYQLATNIDAGDSANWDGGFSPIPEFSGTLDGQGYVITGLTINSPSTDSVGLFKEISADGIILNLGLEDVNIKGNGSVGGLAGVNRGIIENSYTTGSVYGAAARVGGLLGENEGQVIDSYSEVDVDMTASYASGLIGLNSGMVSGSFSRGTIVGGNYVGGLVARNTGDGEVIRSYSTSHVTGRSYVGGLVGDNVGGKVQESYTSGEIVGLSGSTAQALGGLVGINRQGGEIKWSYSTASVTSSNTNGVGGLVGAQRDTATIVQSYSSGKVTGATSAVNVGGLLGNPEGGSVTSSYWNINASEQDTSAGGTGLTSDQMASTTFWKHESQWTGIIDFGAGEGTIWRFYDNDDAPLLKSLIE